MLKTKSNDNTSATSRSTTVVGLGELIWDLLPDGKSLGGATTNFAYMSRLLGNRSIVASRVGDDELGREAKTRLALMKIVTNYLQFDDAHPTGTVGVVIDELGEAHYSMNEDSAWDYLQWTEAWNELSRAADVVCFGTMAQREPQSRNTIIRFIENTRSDALRIFDVNLRHAFFTGGMLAESLRLATIAKLNSEELAKISGMLGLLKDDDAGLARQMIVKFDIDLIAITRGDKGSLLITEHEEIDHPGFQIDVVDTIGSGDAFTAALAHFYRRRASLEIISEAANRMGSWVATQVGATPAADQQMAAEVLGDLCPKQ